jgi:hypothetical protein
VLTEHPEQTRTRNEWVPLIETASGELKPFRVLGEHVLRISCELVEPSGKGVFFRNRQRWLIAGQRRTELLPELAEIMPWDAGTIVRWWLRRCTGKNVLR